MDLEIIKQIFGLKLIGDYLIRIQTGVADNKLTKQGSAMAPNASGLAREI